MYEKVRIDTEKKRSLRVRDPAEARFRREVDLTGVKGNDEKTGD